MSGDQLGKTCPSFQSGLDAVMTQRQANPAPNNLDAMIAVAKLQIILD